MIINCETAGFFEWEALPAGIEPTERDVKQHRVKQSADGKWLVRVHVKQASSWTCSINEAELQDRYIFHELKGVERDRDQIVVAYLDEFILQHHVKVRDVIDVDVVDDGPLGDVFRARLEALGDTFSPTTINELVDRYSADKSDVEGALERFFNVAKGA